MRVTRYAEELETADIGGQRVERLKVRSSGQEEIRFSWWKAGRFAPRPLDLPEPELLDLFRQAIQKRLFAESFLVGLENALKNRPQGR